MIVNFQIRIYARDHMDFKTKTKFSKALKCLKRHINKYRDLVLKSKSPQNVQLLFKISVDM